MSSNTGFEGGAVLDTGIASVARVYDYMLGGKDNFAVDRQLGDDLMAAFPDSVWIARQNRAFLGRAVSFCAEQGMKQFLDIGSGLPTMENVHEVARRVHPDAAVVYVDNDATALTHANALLAAIFHFITDDEDPIGIVRTFAEAMPSGSYLILTTAHHDSKPEESARATRMYRRASSPMVTRSKRDIAAFFEGFELADPGLACTCEWRTTEPPEYDDRADLYGGVGRKP